MLILVETCELESIMNIRYYNILLLFFTLLSLKSSATHIVGGEIYYDCLGGNNYRITLKLYRDCSIGITTPFDNPASIFIFNSSGIYLDSLEAIFPGAVVLPNSLTYPCLTLPANVCVEEAIYQVVVNLPPLAGGYDLVYQRCCRNGTILNLIGPGNLGSTYMTHIPDPGLAICNSSPHYNNFPPIFVCADTPINFDHSATDTDGDSLHYELCDLYIGLDPICPILGVPAQNSNCPPIASPPPYTFVPWLSPYSGTYPLSSSPALAINPITGIMTGTPNMIGQWAVAVCVSEYRNGVLLGVNKRDFQFNVVNCGILVPTTQTICSGDSTNITLSSNVPGTTFAWTIFQSGVTGATPGTGPVISQTLTTTGTLSGIVVYTITPTVNGCSGNPIVDTVTVNTLVDASFIYSSATFCQTGTDPTPALTGLPGGTFSSIPVGLSINTATGTIDLSASALGTYTVSYNLNGTCPNSDSIILTIVNTIPSATFSYSNPLFCQNGTNPLPIFGSGANAGIFSASPLGLVFINSNTGNIDLSSSIPGTYTVTNTIPASGTCNAASATTIVIIAIADDASFSYSSATYCTSGTNPTPVITGLSGGGFSSTPTGLTINPATGTINLSTSALGSYLVSYGTLGPCPNTSSMVITITDTTPSTNFNYTGSSFCQSATNPFPIYVPGASGGVFSATPAGLVFVQVNTGEIDLASSSPGIYTVTNTIPASGTCLGSTATTTITINSAPVITSASGLQTGCDSTTTSILLTSSIPGTTYSWTIVQLALTGASPGTGSTIFQTLNLTGTSQGSVAYTITPNAGGCNGIPLVIPIIINPVPVADTSAVVITPASCGSPTGGITGVIMVSGQPLFQYVWTDSAGTIVGTNVNLNNVIPGIYTLTIIDGNGCSCPPMSFTIPVAVSDDASFIYSSATYCQSGINPTPAITGLPGGTFSFNPSGLSINVSTGTIDLALSSLGTYTVSYTTNGPCPNVNSAAITIGNTTPSATFTYSSSSFCQNGLNPSPIFSSGSSAGIFSATPAGLVFVNVNTGEIDLASSIPGTYTITDSIASSGTCIGTSGTTSVIITPADDASFTYSSGTYCTSGADPTPVITGLPGGTFSSTPVGLSLNSTTGTINLAASVLGAYTLSYLTSGPCPNFSFIIMTITDTTPSANFSYTSSTFCQNEPNPFPVYGSGASAGIYSAVPAGLVFVHVNTGQIDLVSSSPGTYTITNTIPASGTCLATIATAIITINSSPIVTTSSALQIICDGTTTSILLTSSLPGTTFSWSIVQLALTGAAPGGGSSISQTLNLTGTSQGSVSYTIVPNAGGCIGTPIVIPIIVNPIPIADTTGAIVSATNCSSNTGSITGITVTFGQPPYTYVWHDSTGAIVGNGTLDLINAGSGIYSLTVTDANGCSTLSPIGPFTITSASGVTAVFSSNPITGETPLTVNFTNNSVGAASYLWQFGTGDTSSTTNPTYVYVPLGNFTVCLVAIDNGGCSDTACSAIAVFINSAFIVPNIFTPNNDNVNDVFAVIGKGLKTLDAEIYNRWGQKLYEWHTINGGWNGYSASGVKVSDGTYYYIINATGTNGEVFFKKGSFSLER